MGKLVVPVDSDNYCANCSCSLAHVRSCNKIYKLDILVHLPPEKGSLVSCENISVISALKDLSSFRFQCQFSQGHSDQEHLTTRGSLKEDEDVPLCLPCSLVLQDLYRSFKLFTSLRKDTSHDSQLASPTRPSRSMTQHEPSEQQCSSPDGSGAGSPAGSDSEDADIKFELMDDIFDESEVRHQEQLIENSRLGIASEVIIPRETDSTPNDCVSDSSEEGEGSDSSWEGSPSMTREKRRRKIKPQKEDSAAGSSTIAPKVVQREKKRKQDLEWVEKATLTSKQEAQSIAVGSGWKIYYTNAWKGRNQVTYYCQRDGKKCPVRKRIVCNERDNKTEVIYYETVEQTHLAKIEKPLTVEVKAQLKKFVREGITLPQEIMKRLDEESVPPTRKQLKTNLSRTKRKLEDK